MLSLSLRARASRVARVFARQYQVRTQILVTSTLVFFASPPLHLRPRTSVSCWESKAFSLLLLSVVVTSVFPSSFFPDSNARTRKLLGRLGGKLQIEESYKSLFGQRSFKQDLKSMQPAAGLTFLY